MSEDNILSDLLNIYHDQIVHPDENIIIATHYSFLEKGFAAYEESQKKEVISLKKTERGAVKTIYRNEDVDVTVEHLFLGDQYICYVRDDHNNIIEYHYLNKVFRSKFELKKYQKDDRSLTNVPKLLKKINQSMNYVFDYQPLLLTDPAPTLNNNTDMNLTVEQPTITNSCNNTIIELDSLLDNDTNINMDEYAAPLVTPPNPF